MRFFLSQVLHELGSRGVTELVAPEKLFQLCSIAQLTSPDAAAAADASAKREALLTVALEHHMVSFLNDCVVHWFDGENEAKTHFVKSTSSVHQY